MSATFDRRFDLGGPCSPTGTMAVQTAYKQSTLARSSSFPILQSELGLGLSSDMRTFSLNGPYGMNISLSTAIGGKFSITFPRYNHRASSEPPLTVSPGAPTIAHDPAFINHSISVPVDNVSSQLSLPNNLVSCNPSGNNSRPQLCPCSLTCTNRD